MGTAQWERSMSGSSHKHWGLHSNLPFLIEVRLFLLCLLSGGISLPDCPAFWIWVVVMVDGFQFVLASIRDMLVLRSLLILLIHWHVAVSPMV